MKLSRRVFLGTAVGGGLLAAMGGSVLIPSPVPVAFQAFSRGEMETLLAMADALYPPEALGVGARDVDVAGQADVFVAGMLPRERHLTRLMVRLIEQKARLDEGRAFSSLTTETRASLINRWEEGGGLWALGVRAIRALTALAFFADQRVHKVLGWGVGCQAWYAGLPAGGPK